MAKPMTATHPGARRSEESDAVYGVVMAVTATSGAMIAVFDVVEGTLPLIAAPTIVLLAALAQRSTVVSAWAGVAVWVLVLGKASGLAVLAPILMAGLCLAFAVGPDRLLDWIRDEWIGREEDPRAEVGWIEEDRTRR
jgi:hypothetical protein